jgi:prevent-host-death family protein
MKTIMNVAEAKAKLSELIERAERGEEVFIARKGKTVVKIVAANEVPTVKPNRANLFGALEGQWTLTEEALAPEPLDAWYSEQPIAEFEDFVRTRVSEPAKPFDHKG